MVGLLLLPVLDFLLTILMFVTGLKMASTLPFLNIKVNLLHNESIYHIH